MCLFLCSFSTQTVSGGSTYTGFVYLDSRWYRVTARSKTASLFAKGRSSVTGCSLSLSVSVWPVSLFWLGSGESVVLWPPAQTCLSVCLSVCLVLSVCLARHLTFDICKCIVLLPFWNFGSSVCCIYTAWCRKIAKDSGLKFSPENMQSTQN